MPTAERHPFPGAAVILRDGAAPRGAPASALAELEALAGTRTSVLLPFLGPRIAGQVASFLKLGAEAGIDLKRLSRDGVEIFFTQVFRHGFFHADMHPGNILVGDAGEDFNRYIALDFGIVGTLSEFDKNYLAQNSLAFFRRDYRRVAELHVAQRTGLATTRDGRPVTVRPATRAEWAMRAFDDLRPLLSTIATTLVADPGTGAAAPDDPEQAMLAQLLRFIGPTMTSMTTGTMPKP